MSGGLGVLQLGGMYLAWARLHDTSIRMGPQDFVLGKLREIEGVTVAEPAGAFYVLPRMDAFFGEGARAEGFGDVPDPDTLCR